MTNGFVLDDGPINERINCFPDTHLLKLPTNCPDDFPTPLKSSSEDEDENEEPDDDDEKCAECLTHEVPPTEGVKPANYFSFCIVNVGFRYNFRTQSAFLEHVISRILGA